MKNLIGTFKPVFIAILLLAASLIITGCGRHSDYYPATVVTLDGKVQPPSSGCYIGAYTNGFSNITTYKSNIGRDLACVMWYLTMSTGFPTADVETVLAMNAVPMITLEPFLSGTYPLQAIVDGDHDAYFRQWARDAKAVGKPIFLRFAHEMNGNWYPWSGFENGGEPGAERYKQAWRRIHDIFAAEGAANVTWVWSVNAINVPDAGWNQMENYYPGDEYVDWIGIDGYNFGTSSAGNTWQTFDEVFSGVYAHLLGLYPDKPLMIAEFASGEDGGDKAGWITDAFAKIKASYSGIKMFVWFNEDKEADWRVESSTQSRIASEDALRDSYFIDIYE